MASTVSNVFSTTLEKSSTVADVIDFLSDTMKNNQNAKNIQVFVTDTSSRIGWVSIKEYDDKIVIGDSWYNVPRGGHYITLELLHLELSKMPHQKPFIVCIEGDYYEDINIHISNKEVIINYIDF